VGILAYQHDDTYVSVRRNYNSGAGGQTLAVCMNNGVGDGSAAAGLTNMGIEFAVGPEPDESIQSVLFGGQWATCGSVTGIPTLALSNARVAIQVDRTTRDVASDGFGVGRDFGSGAGGEWRDPIRGAGADPVECGD